MRITLAGALVVAALLSVGSVTAAPPVQGPIDVTGELNGAPYRIIVPENWNGRAIQFVKGLVDKADHPGEVDDRTPVVAPPAVRALLLEKGYALSGSARQDNGYSVREGLHDVIALASHFRSVVGKPDVSLLWGSSMGTIITLETAERDNGAFDGYLAQCAVGGGSERNLDSWGVLRLAYDVAFGMPAAWGTPADVRDDVDYETEVFPILSPQLANPLNFGRFEFVRMVAGVPGTGVPVPPSLFPGALAVPMFVATEIASEVERRAGGPVVQNVDHVYGLAAGEKAYLATLGVDADALLAAMNARRTTEAEPAARNYLRHYATYTGHIKRPVLTLHTRLDQIVPVAHEAVYRETVAAAGRSELLAQAFTSGNGHCAFTPAQLMAAVSALEKWVETGDRPGADAFPAGLGFLPDFEPPRWPQP